MAISNSTDRFNGVLSTLAIKAPCAAVAIANITLSGEQTVNGVAVVAGDRVLVTAQTAAKDNGIYDVSGSAWARSPDFDGNRDIVSGTLVTVATATVGRNPYYQVTTANPITIGTTAINFTLADGPNVSYALTTTEDAAGLTDNDIDDSLLPGDVNRYGDNTVPGTTSMATASQNALNSNALVIYPWVSGGYFHPANTTLTVSSNTTIIGYDTLISCGAHTGPYDLFQATGKTQIHIKGLDFQAPRTTTRHLSGDADFDTAVAEGSASAGALISYVQAIHLITCTDCSVEDCRFDGIHVAVKSSTSGNEDLRCNNLTFKDVTSQGVLVSHCKRANIIGINAEDMGQSRFDHVVYMSKNDSPFNIDDINVNGSSGSCISLTANTGGDTSTSNVSNLNLVDVRSGLDISEPAANLTTVNIDNVNIKNAEVAAMAILSGSNINISNFTIEDPQAEAISVGTGSCNNLSFSHGWIIRTVDVAVRLQTTGRRVFFDDIKFIDCLTNNTSGKKPFRDTSGKVLTGLFLSNLKFLSHGTTGAHDGANDASVLTDSGESWTTNEWVGKLILNVTDGSEGTITANTGTTITATLSGGTDNDWDAGDTYNITTPDSQSIDLRFGTTGMIEDCFFDTTVANIRNAILVQSPASMVVKNNIPQNHTLGLLDSGSTGALPFAYQGSAVSELVTATNVILAAESGRTFYLNAAGGFTSTLPAPAVGLKYKFVVSTAPTTAYVITTDSGDNVLFGFFLDIVGEQVYFSAQDTLNFVASASLVSDFLEVESDGTNWYCTAKSGADGGITVSVT